jgi:predicted RNA-binding protein with PIN domain
LAPSKVSGQEPGRRGATIIVDGNNVIGSVPDGWWRDRPAAARRLLVRLQCYAALTGRQTVLVLDLPQPDLPEGDHGGVGVTYPDRPGRNAGDRHILKLLDHLQGDEGQEPPLEVVTSDRALADEAARRQAKVIGAGAFLAGLKQLGC